MATPVSTPSPTPFVRAEWLVLLVLASVQFTSIMDFMIVMPLGPQFMRVFRISPTQFGLIVSAYTFSASVFGFLGAFFVDRFDRKRALLTLYAGFAIGTLCCALAPTYGLFVAARIVAGAFGGIMGAMVFAIIGDVIPVPRRGAATGIVMAAFSVASIIGLPFGLYLANRFSWHAPFVLLAGLSVVFLTIGLFVLPPMRHHLNADTVHAPLKDMGVMLSRPNHLKALALTTMLMMAGFTVIPFISPYMVANVHLTESELTYIYLFGGLATLYTAPLVGRLADRFGKFPLFRILAVLAVVPTVLLTNLPVVSLTVAVALTTVFMITTSGRMVAAVALIMENVEPAYRGGFMSVNSSVQHLAAGLASTLAAFIIGDAVNGALHRYEIVGLLGAMASLVCVLLAQRLRAQPMPVHTLDGVVVEPAG